MNADFFINKIYNSFNILQRTYAITVLRYHSF